MLSRRQPFMNGLGQAIVPFWIFNSDTLNSIYAIHSIFVGLSISLLCAISLIFWKRPIRRLATWLFYLASSTSLVIMLYIYLALISLKALTLKQRICESIQSTLYPTSEDSDVTSCAIYGPQGGGLHDKVWLPMYVFQVALIVVSDGAITYRAILINRNRVSQGLLGVAWIIVLAIGFATSFLYEASTLPSQESITVVNSYLSFAFICWSLVCNVIATGAMGMVLWYHRHQFKEMGHTKPFRLSLPLRILAMLLETGGVYCAFQALYLIFLYRMSDKSLSAYESGFLLQTLHTGLSGFYPALVFLIGNAQASCSDGYVMGTTDSIILTNTSLHR